MQKIVLVEDEEDISALIKLQATILGYKIIVSADGLNGYATIEREKPDIIVLDIMLPGQSGLDICRKVRAHPDLGHTPIIILSAKSEETDVVLGLEFGADDYVPKPFSPKILFSRIKAVLRRYGEKEESVDEITFGDFSIEQKKYSVKRKDQPLSLTLSEFTILCRMASHKGKVFTRNQLLDSLQTDDLCVVDRNVDVHIAGIRKKLGPGFEYIETVRGVGYRFKVDD